MATQKQWIKKLKALNLPIGRIAEKNAQGHGTDMEVESLRLNHAICCMFPFWESEQGMQFWLDVVDAVQLEEEEAIERLIEIEEEGF